MSESPLPDHSSKHPLRVPADAVGIPVRVESPFPKVGPQGLPLRKTRRR